MTKEENTGIENYISRKNGHKVKKAKKTEKVRTGCDDINSVRYKESGHCKKEYL